MSNIKFQNANMKIENYIHDCRLKMGEIILEIREKRGYRQDKSAGIMEVNRSAISKIENLVLVLV